MSLQNTNHSKIQQMALIGLMTAMICILAPFSVLLPFSPIPISLGTLTVYISSTILGMKRGFVSVAMYLLLGFAGMPVFTGFSGGIGRLLGPTGGYLIGYLFIALFTGYFADKWNNHIFFNFLGALSGTIICYVFGSLWLSYQANLSPASALGTGVLPFIPADIVKLIAATTIGYQVRNRLKKAALL